MILVSPTYIICRFPPCSTAVIPKILSHNVDAFSAIRENDSPFLVVLRNEFNLYIIFRKRTCPVHGVVLLRLDPFPPNRMYLESNKEQR